MPPFFKWMFVGVLVWFSLIAAIWAFFPKLDARKGMSPRVVQVRRWFGFAMLALAATALVFALLR